MNLKLVSLCMAFAWGSSHVYGQNHYYIPDYGNGRQQFSLFVETLFDFAELQYPEIFPTPETTQVFQEDSFQYWIYRYYAASHTYLAVKDYVVYVYGPNFGPKITSVGNLDEVLKLVTPGLVNPGSQECVNIGYPEAGTVARYAGTKYFHYFGSQISWQVGEEGLKLIGEKSYVDQDIYSSYLGVDRIVSISGMDYIKWSSREYDSNVYMPDDDLLPTQRKVEWLYDPGLLLGPTSRYCVGQRWYSPGVPMSESLFRSREGSPSIVLPNQSQISIGMVNAINIPITVTAGDFVTVLTTVVGGEGETLTRWTDIETGIVVKEMANVPGIGDWFHETRRVLMSLTKE